MPGRGVELLEELAEDLAELKRNPHFRSLWTHLNEMKDDLVLELRSMSEQPTKHKRSEFVETLSRINQMERVLSVPTAVRADLNSQTVPPAPLRSKGER